MEIISCRTFVADTKEGLLVTLFKFDSMDPHHKVTKSQTNRISQFL